MEFTNLVERALQFALNAHAGMKRKLVKTPYILHPMEVATIAASMTTDEDIIAAALLHDVVEDTDFGIEVIREKFGDRVAELVLTETENKRLDLDPKDTWLIRKQESLEVLAASDTAAKILWLSDKLSNMRSFYREFLLMGDEMWQHFNQKDKNMHRWYYAEIAKLTKELSGFTAWKEYDHLVRRIFGGNNE